MYRGDEPSSLPPPPPPAVERSLDQINSSSAFAKYRLHEGKHSMFCLEGKKKNCHGRISLALPQMEVENVFFCLTFGKIFRYFFRRLRRPVPSGEPCYNAHKDISIAIFEYERSTSVEQSVHGLPFRRWRQEEHHHHQHHQTGGGVDEGAHFQKKTVRKKWQYSVSIRGQGGGIPLG